MFFFPGMSVPSYDVKIDGNGAATYEPQGAPHRMQGHRDKEEWQQRDPDTAKTTEAQMAKLQQLMLSSEFSDDEVSDTDDWLYSAAATEAKCTLLIDRALHRIRSRDARKEASQQRRKQYHRNK